MYQIWCKDNCTKFGTNFNDTLAYSYCLQSPIWVHHFCTKFGTLYFYPNLVHYTYTKFGKKIYTPLIFLILIRILRQGLQVAMFSAVTNLDILEQAVTSIRTGVSSMSSSIPAVSSVPPAVLDDTGMLLLQNGKVILSNFG